MVAKGYKQTELGVIPDDWEISELQHLIDNTPDYGIGAAAVKFNLNLPVYLRITDITDDGKFSKSNISSVDNKFSCNYILEKGDIVIARTGASVGKSYKYIEEDGKLVFAGFLIRIKPNKQKLNSNYLFAITQSRYYKNWIVTNSMRSGQPGINSVQLNKLLITHPPLPEQTAIAEALSDMDALIVQTEKLIEKKKAIKQGMMQELFTPKEGWVTKKLGDHGTTYGGITGKSKIDFGKGVAKYIPFMNIMTNPIIEANYLELVDIKPTESQNKVSKGDLFFNGSSETPEEVGMCSVLDQEVDNVFLNSFCFGFRFNSQSEFNGYFLSYYFRSQLGRNLVFSLAQGATRYNLSKTNLLKLELPLPSKQEQDIIAEIITDIDNEIRFHNTKLQKLKYQKQGMMQALLTGKIRLI